MKAMILSAGFGTRLEHYTDKIPKALVPYRNIPMINHQIERLKKIGAEEIVVNAHHHSNVILDYFAKNNFGENITVIIEEEILGTGGGILNAEDYFRDEEYFLVMNVDIETDMDLNQMILYHQSKKPFATIAVQKRKTRRYLEFDNEMKLTGRANENSDVSNEYAFNGIHIISKRIFNQGYGVKFEDILEIYFNVIKGKKEFVSGYDCGESTFKDLGKIENLLS
ncbi:MAG TPA: nucleotidyltransferase family protein [Ignavibacteria bacterium]|nr:nucleotidyltransferase family protein [Ignavibacteria bacterium]